MKYRREIDGLRTIAVIPVILFHLDYSFVKGGFFGVDVFFVISGYLITKILTSEIENGNFSMYHFWMRRLKRLLPLLLTVILATLIITSILIFNPTVKSLSYDIFPALFSYFNFHALYNYGDYWGGKASESFLLHTWSLSVEEQFYLIYPIFLFIVHRYFKNYVIPILTITIVSVFLFFLYAKIIQNVDTAFYMLPTRIWELSIGGLIGVININKIRYKNHLPIIGIILIIISYLIGNKTLYALPVVGSALIILFCTPNDIIGRLLSTNLFVFIGKISYSLYLWHWTIIVLYKNLQYQLQYINQYLINGIIFLLTFILAYLSYIIIENKTRNNIHTPKIVLVGIVIIAGFTFYLQSDFYKQYYKSKYNRSTSYVYYYDISPIQIIQEADLCYNTNTPLRLKTFNDAYKKEGIVTNKKNGNPKVLLLGDSHGVMWAKTLNELTEEINLTLSCYTTNAVKPFFNIKNINMQDGNKYYSKNQRIEYAKSITENIEKWKPQIVVIICRWESIDEKMNEQFNDLLLSLEKRKVNVLLFTQPPVLSFIKDNNASQYFTYLGIQPKNGYNLIEVNNSKVEKSNDYIKSLATKYTNVSIYDVYKNMILDNKIKISLNNDILYFDDDHLNYFGTSIHKQNISMKINSILNSYNETVAQ